MAPKTGLFSSESLRRIFGMPAPTVERRVANHPVMVERRQGPQCENCGVGTLQPVAVGNPAGGPSTSGQLRCSSPNCADLTATRNAQECVIRAS